MADLLVPNGDTDRPWDAPARVPDGGPAPDESPGAAAGPKIAIAEVPEWVLEQVDQVSYPTRMARRRALEAARISDGWQPAPHITPPLLERVEVELERYPDSVDGSAQVLPSQRTSGRGPWRWVAAVAAAVLLAVGAGVVLGHRGGGATQRPTATASAPTQQVVALAIARGGQLTGVSLLAAGADDGDAQQVLVPSRLLLDVPGAGRMPVAQSLAPGASAPGAAIADALEIKLAGTWVLDAAQLATLVDGLGGLTVDVDVDVPADGREGSALLASAGAGQRLNGTQAAAYATLLVGDEPEAARLARQERVVTALLAALPTDAVQRRAMVVGLAGAPRGAVLTSVLEVTGALHDAAARQAVASTVVPVREIDTGGAVNAYGLDSAAATTMVQARLAGAAIAVPPGGRLRVLVQNGDGAPGLGDAARSKLVAAGLKYLGGGNVDGFGVQQTMVLLPDASSTSRARGLAVTHALGLRESALRITDNAPTVADVVVVLGHDFKAS
ncbi:MAG TPA: LytR C-terminal domain-containing protein [Angustibacter sp.]|nr:LytR C-terminal domain-containing protein [Angustibacter sp.]